MLNPNSSAFSNIVGGLIVIDDLPLRQESFRSAEIIIKKIDRIEAIRRAFHDTDQQLFKEWFQLTFSAEQAQVSQLQGEFRELARFHNWMIAVSELQHLPMFEAYHIVAAEAEAYKTANAEVRARIDHERDLRDRYLEDDLKREQTKKSKKASPNKRTNSEEELFKRLWDTDDEKLREICQDEEMAFELLSLAARLSYEPKDHELFLRVWAAMPEEHQNEFSHAFQKKHKTSIEDAIHQMHETVNQAKREESGQHERMDFSEPVRYEPELPPADEEKIKILYRRIVRHLHPDMQGQDGERLPLWHRTLWERTQKAYRKRDLPEIEKLLRITLLRLRQFNNLSVSEIRNSQSWLKEELNRLKDETKQMRKLPAWGFSRVKSDKNIAGRMRKQFRRDIEATEAKILQLRLEHARLKRLRR